MFRRLPLSVCLSGALLAGCSATPDPYDPFAPNSRNVAPPQVYGGEPQSRAPYGNLTAAPRPEMPAAYQQAPAALPANPTPAAPGAYQGRPPSPAVPVGANPEPAAFNAGPATPVDGNTGAAPTPPRVADKPSAPEPADPHPSDAIGQNTDDVNPYGHASDYGWLRGRLEYSHVEGAWKLRYAPIDVENDPHGGSVVLGNDSRLREFQEGDIVYVEGRTLGGPTGVFTAGPRYEVRQITRLEKP